MSYWTFVLLLIAITYLAYQNPRIMLQYLPPWFRPAERIEQTATMHEDGELGRDKARSHGPMILVGDDNAGEEQTTPRAKTTELLNTVPSLSLDSGDSIRAETQSKLSNGTAASNSTAMQPTATMLPPSKSPPPPAQKASPGLMPPPSRPSLAPPLSSASALRVPSSGPLPNRGPPANSQQRVGGGGLSANGIVVVPNPRGKVLLSPGHSPMDWAALTKSSNLSGVSTFQRVTPSMLKIMTGRKGKPAWSSWQGKVYNITPYLDFHPGGKAELMKAAGRDGTKLFMEVHPWVNWENMLGTCLVGVLVPDNFDVQGDGTDLEDID